MPDYTSILRRSISALPDPTPEMREAVYQRARAALARQLTAVEPPLSTREIESQHQELENAVTRLEADYAPDEPEAVSVDERGGGDPAYYAAQPRASHYPELPSEGAGDEPLDGAELEDEGFEEEEEERVSRVPLFAAIAVLAIVVLGLGAYGFAKRDAIAGFFASSGDNVAVVDATPTPVDVPDAEPAPAVDDSDKIEERLTNGSEPAQPDTPVVEAPLPADDAVPATPLPSEATTGEEQTAALAPTDQGLVAQRAIYYFQGAEGSPGRAVEGSVTWAQTSRDSGPAVQATLQLAEPNVTTTVTIYRNTDASLPASHMVEVEFDGALGSTEIQRVPALVLKSTEQARGDPLTGAAVPVVPDHLFWIALSDDATEAARNVQLLREGAWFDIPILFSDGTRALLTFEKGVPGDRVFETVMAAWTPS